MEVNYFGTIWTSLPTTDAANECGMDLYEMLIKNNLLYITSDSEAESVLSRILAPKCKNLFITAIDGDMHVTRSFQKIPKANMCFVFNWGVSVYEHQQYKQNLAESQKTVC